MLELVGQYLQDVVGCFIIVISGSGGSRTFSHILAQGFSTTEAPYLTNALTFFVHSQVVIIPQNPPHSKPDTSAQPARRSDSYRMTDSTYPAVSRWTRPSGRRQHPQALSELDKLLLGLRIALHCWSAHVRLQSETYLHVLPGTH